MTLPGVKINFDYNINLGHIVLAVAIFGWTVMGYVTRFDVTQSNVAIAQADLKSLRIDVASQLDKFRLEVTTQLSAIQIANNEQFRTVRADIANLPEVKADMTQINRRVDQADNRADAQSKRLDNVEKATIQSSADIVNILRLMGPKPSR